MMSMNINELSLNSLDSIRDKAGNKEFYSTRRKWTQLCNNCSLFFYVFMYNNYCCICLIFKLKIIIWCWKHTLVFCCRCCRLVDSTTSFFLSHYSCDLYTPRLTEFGCFLAILLLCILYLSIVGFFLEYV